MKEKRVYNVNAIEKADKVLTYIKDTGGASFIDIYNTFDIPKSSLYRIISYLDNMGYIFKKQNGKYVLGLKCYALGYESRKKLDIVQVARPLLCDLKNKIDSIIHLHTGILTNDYLAIYVDIIRGDKYATTSEKIGDKIEINCSAVGKALLAWQPQEIIEKCISNLTFKKYNENTITSKEKFIEELKITKARGYSIDNAERQQVVGIGVPVFDWSDKVIAAISMGFLAPLFNNTPQNIEELARRIQEVSKEITRKIGVVV